MNEYFSYIVGKKMSLNISFPCGSRTLVTVLRPHYTVIQSTLSETDTMGTGDRGPSYGGVCLIEVSFNR